MLADSLFSFSAKNKVGIPRFFGRSQFGKTKYGYGHIYFAPGARRVSRYGQSHFGVSLYGYGADDLGGFLVDGIYQKRHSSKGTITAKMQFYQPKNPRSVSQQANRAKFTAAMVAWQDLTEPQKAVYRERAKKRSMFGWGLFIREFYKQN